MGPYRIVGRLGAGGMGIVYAGVDAAGQRAAVKLIHDTYAANHEFRVRFRREVAMLRRVHGACCVRILAADAEAELPWLATEFIDGRTLDEHVKARGPLTGDELFGLAAGLAEALVAVHAAEVVHRDLKAANVMLSPAGPRLVDFGIARSLDGTSLTGTGLVIGSPGWVSPEEYLGGPTGPAADVYGWALVVVFAATGSLPYGMGRPEVLSYRVMNDAVDTGAVPRALRPTVDAALAKSPGSRPSMDEVLAAVAAAWREQHGETGDRPGDPALDVTARLNRVWHVHQEDAAAWPQEPADPPRRGLVRRLWPVIAGAAAVGSTAVILVNLPSGEKSGTGASAPPSSTLSGTPVAGRPSASAAPRTAVDLAAALDLSLSVTPTADFTFEGGFTQSSAGAKATGRLLSGDARSEDDFAMSIKPYEERAGRYVVTDGLLRPDRPGAAGTVLADQNPDSADWYALMVAGTAGPSVIQQVVLNTSDIHPAGRTYTGVLPASATGGRLRMLLASWLGADVSEESGASYLNYRLTIDANNRPTKFSLTWKVPVSGTGTYESVFTTTYRGWRAGEPIGKPAR
uniref:Putative serine/threonine protein kinase n=1 Tax=Nonomuraea gerenzanensis TaxID=93944 RepID=A0A1M4DVT0_9ACTN|nr:putative serine/threonine protein kinase [Nonomuraea gerenzanensis]